MGVLNMVKKKLEKGTPIEVWVSKNLDDLIERVCKVLGLTKSELFRFAIINLLKEIGLLTEVIKNNAREDLKLYTWVSPYKGEKDKTSQK